MATTVTVAMHALCLDRKVSVTLTFDRRLLACMILTWGTCEAVCVGLHHVYVY